MKKTSENLKAKLSKCKKCSRIQTIARLLLINFFVISCSSVPLKPDSVQTGEWEARVLVKDLRQSKTYLVNIDFVAVKSNKLRMDITTPLGIHVASLAINDKKTTYIVPQKKSFYEGPSSAKAFMSILNFPLDPRLVLNILFDKPVQFKGWACKNDKKNFVSECSRGEDPLKISWSQRRFKEKLVQLNHAQFEIEMKFHHFSPLKQVKEELFTIAQPNGFNKIF